MKRLFTIACTILLSFQAAYADGYQDFHSAVSLYAQSKYEQARSLFVSCQATGEFDSVNISIWIGRCDAGIQEQRHNAQAAAARYQRRLTEIKKNQFVYLSVNAAETGDLYGSTESAMAEVMRLNGRQFCPKIEDALTVVTVVLNIKPEEEKDGFFKVVGSGFVRLGSAINEKDFVGQWTVDCEATSAINIEDAKRLLRNKINYRLRYALDNLLNERPQSVDFYIPEQSVSVYFAKNNSYSEESLSYLRESLNSYISKTPGIVLSTALDRTKNEERDDIAQIQAQYVKMESRAPIHELEGFAQILRISVRQEPNGFITLIGEISELGTGKSLTTVTIDGTVFNISKDNILTAKSQELAAKLLAVGLGFKRWSPGEDIGGYKLAKFDGLHGLIIRVVSVNFTPIETIEALRRRDKSLDADWRYPHTEELLDMFSFKKELGLASIFWTADVPANRMHEAVDFRLPKTEATKRFKDNKSEAALLLVKEF